jgi:hypothetical protein
MEIFFDTFHICLCRQQNARYTTNRSYTNHGYKDHGCNEFADTKIQLTPL